MSAFFPGTAASLLESNAPVSAVPFTLGMWLRPAATVSVYVPYVLYSSANPSSQQFFFYLNNTRWAGGGYGPTNTDENDFTSGTIVAGTWNFMLARFISATNRRFAALAPDGSVSTLNQTVNIGAPTGINTVSLGTDPDNHPWFGDIAEYWLANIDVWPGGGAIDNSFLQYLAFNGPFSVPRIAAAVQDYRPLIQGISSDVDVPGENWRAAGIGAWVNNGGVTLSPHPPLAPGYRRPSDRRLVLPV